MPRQSKLSVFCEKFIQAGWLIALIVAPLYFNIYSSRVFEPDKISLIRTLALAMGAAWLILRAERWGGNSSPVNAEPMPFGARVRGWIQSTWRANPLTLPTLLLLLAYIISTLLSLSPTVSFFGSYQRLQGLYTFSSYAVIFFLAASLLQTRADVERAISIALITSFPIALYGIVQHYFVDPLPWVGDVTSRVASTLGNSIFIGSFLILAIPLALARVLQTAERTGTNFAGRARIGLYAAAFATFAAVAALWALSFDLSAKKLIETSYSGTLTPEQLNAASSAFTLAVVGSLAINFLWWGAAFLLKRRAANFLLLGAYASLLAVQFVALFFSQSRGPLLGMLGGLFAFGVLYALVRGARKLAIGAVSLAVLVLVLLAVINIPNSPLSFMRELPYVGRLGRVFELEGGTGRVRVLIWQGALKLVLPHEALWAPTTGDDAFNPIRPFVGYGPETMYVAYNKFYPPELGTLESRNATPDRSHNETFDALVTTGLLGFIAENILFLVIFYMALKWLGLMPSARARNIFIALWFGAGALFAVIFGFALGWEFLGVALPGGMMLGFFVYLVAFALRAGKPTTTYTNTALWLIALVALFVAHFIEIHFGIAIVSSRVYFWFFAAVFVALGARQIAMSETDAPAPAPQTLTEAAPSNKTGKSARKSSSANTASKNTPRAIPQRARRVSSAPLITFAFLLGYVLAVMGFDYINTTNVASTGTAISGLDIVISALTVKATTSGGMTSFVMAWVFITTILLGVTIGIAEWGRTFSLAARDWLIAVLLTFVLALAIFSGLVFYHVVLIATPGNGIMDALLGSVTLFTVYMLLVATVIAVSMLFDEPMPQVWARRTTNWVVVPVLAIVAGILITSTNIDPVRADMLYKQAAGLGAKDVATSIKLYERALALQPQQDYYYLFLGRAYLDGAKNATEPAQRVKYITDAEKALHTARAINPFNTDHSANLARLAQANGGLAANANAQKESYEKANDYFAQATRLSPNTAHLYDQTAQSLLEYRQLLLSQNDSAQAEQVRIQALEKANKAQTIDPTFCLTYAVRAQAQDNWRARATDALEAIQRAPACGDVFTNEGLSVAVNALAVASDEAIAAKQQDEFIALVAEAAKTNPTLETFTTLANFYSKTGHIPEAIQATTNAIALIQDATTRKRYEDFRFSLENLQKTIADAQAAPNDVGKQRALAALWLARGQTELALASFQHILEIAPDEYNALRTTALLLIATDQIEQAPAIIARAQALAPANEQAFWNNLNTVVQAVLKQDAAAANAPLQQLTANANAQDIALMSALRVLGDKVKGAG